VEPAPAAMSRKNRKSTRVNALKAAVDAQKEHDEKLAAKREKRKAAEQAAEQAAAEAMEEMSSSDEDVDMDKKPNATKSKVLKTISKPQMVGKRPSRLYQKKLERARQKREKKTGPAPVGPNAKSAEQWAKEAKKISLSSRDKKIARAQAKRTKLASKAKEGDGDGLDVIE